MDLIERQDAIDALDKIFPADPMRNDYTQGITCGAALATEYIKQLPSAQPEPREDAVSRQRLLTDLKELIAAWKKYPVMAEQIKGVEAAIGYAEAIPSVMPKRKTGKWEIIAHESHIGGFTHVKKCSVCGVEQIIRSRFCPNCGARMDGYK